MPQPDLKKYNWQLMSLSTTIETNKKEYYQSLKDAQQSLEVSDWILYFSNIILNAQKNAKEIIIFILNKTKFLDKNHSKMNERQKKVILKMFDAGIKTFKGGMTAKKYLSITKSSRATVTRDLQDLVDKKILIQTGVGRSVSYDLNVER